VKSIVAKSPCRKFVERRRSDGTAKGGWVTEAGIVNQHEENIRRIRRSFHWLSKGRFGSFQRTFRDSLERLGWTRQHTSIPLRIRSDRFGYLRCDSKGSHD